MRLIERRIGLLFAVFLVALVAATLRAGWLGTVRADDLKSRALSAQEEELLVTARRGTITDRHGVELAVSEDAITVFANPFLVKDPAGAARKLAPLLDMTEADLLEKLADRETGFVYLRRKMDAAKGAEVERLEIEGIGTVVEPRRRYPQDFLASQLLGTVGTDNVGLSGLEQSQEEQLHGRDGRRRIVKDALGKPVSIVELQRGEPGTDLRLTIDSAIQERTEAVLAEVGERYRPKGATAIVMDPRNGELLALANWPRVDANDISGAPDYARQNRAVQASYEPGSTFKAITVGSALADRLVTPGTSFHLPSTIKIFDREIGEAHPRPPITATTAEIIAQSSNVGTITIARRFSLARFDRWVRNFGFGRPTGSGLPGEAQGIVLKPEDYSGPTLANMAIGQGLAVTPMQMAAAYAAIANDGILRQPHVIADQAGQPRRVLPATVARQLRTMLKGVLAAGGTASEAAVEGYELAGKTGTAQKADENGGYSEDRYVASFIGFAPADEPRLLVAVMVDEPQYVHTGGAVAAPAFEQIVSFALPYLRIPPE